MDDSDGYALRAETLGATNVGNMLRMLLRLLERSEERIGRTNEIVGKLADACRSVENAYTAHVGSLQTSRDTSQKDNAKLITMLDRVTRSAEKEKEEMQKRIEGLENDKAALREELHSATDKYWKLQEDYRHLAECLASGRNTYTIGCNNNGAANSKLDL